MSKFTKELNSINKKTILRKAILRIAGSYKGSKLFDVYQIDRQVLRDLSKKKHGRFADSIHDFCEYIDANGDKSEGTGLAYETVTRSVNSKFGIDSIEDADTDMLPYIALAYEAVTIAHNDGMRAKLLRVTIKAIRLKMINKCADQYYQHAIPSLDKVKLVGISHD